MSDFSEAKLRRLDLTLLLVFLGLIGHRKAVAAGAELGLTPSAISQALRRLRAVFGDPLFLRRPHGLEPTTTALALAVPVVGAVETLRAALGAAGGFAAARAIVRLAALDAEQAVLVPPFAARLRRGAPGLRLSVLPLGGSEAIEALAQARADLALGFLWNPPATIALAPLYAASYLVAGRPAMLPHAPQVDLDAYCAADHVLVSPRGDLHGIVDERLAAIGRSRRIVLALPAFLAALAAVAASDALVTLPARVARTFAPGFGLSIAVPPVVVRRFPVSLFWHRRHDADPRTRWLVEQLVTCPIPGPLP